MRLSDDTVQRPRLPAAAPLAVGVAVILLSLWLLAPIVAVAQVQIDQVQATTQQVEGATQGEVIVATGDDVSEGQVLGLIQDIAPPIAADGNSASVLQDGNRNDVAIQQAGIGNRAVAEQLGSDNTITITQDGEFLTPALEGNLAVAVHEGSDNHTDIVQRGTGNRAGIRLVGDDNAMNLLQDGNENRFLMDVPEGTVDDLDMTVVQDGNGNSMQTNMPVNAEMNGNGIELTIQRDALGPVSFE